MTSSPPPHIDREMVADALLDSLPARCAALVFDTELRFVAVHGDAVRHAGWAADAIVGRTATELLAAGADTAPLVDASRAALAGTRSQLRIVQDSRAWDINVGPVRDRSGRIAGGIVFGQDISAAQQARRLHDARARAAELIADARDDLAGDLVREVAPVLRCRAAAYWEPGADGALRSTAKWVDPATEGTRSPLDAVHGTGAPSGDGLVGPAYATGRLHVVADLRTQQDAAWARAAVEAGAVAAAAIPAVNRGRAVGVFEFYGPVPIEDDPDVSAAMRALVEDVAHAMERRARVDALQELADHDGLTGLLNRRRFEEELERHAASAARYHRHAALLVLDLDDFKAVNDRYGHAAGDELLRCVAGVLRRRLRASDSAARVGGDEFAVILDGADTTAARHVAEQLADDLAAVRLTSAPELRPSASVGVATISGNGARMAFDAADKAMYAGKRRRR